MVNVWILIAMPTTKGSINNTLYERASYASQPAKAQGEQKKEKNHWLGEFKRVQMNE